MFLSRVLLLLVCWLTGISPPYTVYLDEIKPGIKNLIYELKDIELKIRDLT